MIHDIVIACLFFAMLVLPCVVTLRGDAPSEGDAE